MTPTGLPGQLALEERAAIQLQQEVDAGHQPWRLEPESVARAAAEPEGVDLSGARYLVVGLPPDAGRNRTLVRISTPSATLEVELVQPARQGPTGIWAVKAFRRVQ
ncbi:MAG: hypothetical protein HY534_02045 [Chloroflexi bacterium]|nr:hypothetical protein [Chloroflexota bacterium]